jgi:hypothetical protein
LIDARLDNQRAVIARGFPAHYKHMIGSAAMQTERVTFLTSPDVKRAIAARAVNRGLSLGEYVRRRALDDDDLSPEDGAELATLVAEANAAIPKMQASLERTIATLEESSRKNDAFLRKMGIR